MTTRARVVLQDCKHAIAGHTDDLQAEQFRISWLSVVALLRAVGHALMLVDSKESPAMRRAIDEKFQELQRTKPEPTIFWEFIVAERNRFVKEYDHGIVRRAVVEADQYSLVVDLSNAQGGSMTSPDMKVETYIASGKYAGMNERKVAWQAYDWWRMYLNEVDERAREYAAGGA